MRDLNVFQMHAEQAKANTVQASQDAYSALQSMSSLGTALTSAYNETQQAEFAEQNKPVVLETLKSGLSGAQSLAVGASRTVGSIAAAPFDQSAGLTSLPPQVIEAYNVLQGGDATPDQIYAAQKVLNEQSELAMDGSRYGSTWDEKIKSRLKSQEIAEDITEFFDISDDMELPKESKEKFTQELGDTWDQIQTDWKNDDLSGVAVATKGFVDTLKTVIDNPAGVAHFALENVPSMALGAAGKVGKALLAADQTGYAAGVFRERIDEYAEKNNGELPSSDQIQKEAAFAASAGLAEMVGDSSLLKALTDTKTLKGIVGSTVSEAVTEGYQSAVEGGLAEGKVDGKSIYTGAVIGAASSGVISGAPVAVPKTLKGSARVAKAVGSVIAAEIGATTQAAKAKVTPKKAESVKATETTMGDTADVEASVTVDEDADVLETVTGLAKSSIGEDVTPEVKAANYETASAAIDKATATLQKDYAEFNELSSMETGTAEQVARVKELGANLGPRLKKIQEAKSELGKMKTATPEETRADFNAAVNGDSDAARRTFGSFRTRPSDLTPKQAVALANSDNGLTGEENQELRSYAVVEQTLRSAKGVRDNVINGGLDKETGKPMMGIKNYRDMILSNDLNTRRAGHQGLARFAQLHLDKAERFEQAFRDYQSTGQTQTVQMGDGKSAYVNFATKGVIASIRAEANMLITASQEFSKLADARAEPTQAEVPTSSVDTVGESIEPTQEATQGSVETTPTTVGSDDGSVRLEPEYDDYQEDTGTEEYIDTGAYNPEEEVTPVQEPVQEVAEVVPTQVEDYSLSKQLTAANPIVKKFFVGGNKTKALNHINNFMTRLRGDTANTLAAAMGTVPVEAKLVASEFVKWDRQFNTGLGSVWKTKNVINANTGLPYADADYVQLLADETGQLPENIKTAMSVGSYNWIVANGKSSNFKSVDDVRNKLGMANDARVPDGVMDMIPTGDTKQTIIQSMGQAAFKTLNLGMTNDAPIDAQTRMETAMGLWMYESMIKSGVLIGSKPVPFMSVYNVVAPMYEKDNTPSWVKKLNSTAQLEVANLNMTPEMEELIKSNSDYSAFTDKVFGSEVEKTLFDNEPQEVAKTYAKSSQQVPKPVQNILNKDNKRKWSFRTTANSFLGLSEDAQQSILGFDYNPERSLTVNQAGITAKNQKIKDELETIKEAFASIGSGTFHLKHSPWRNGRIGLANKLNPQGSKFFRYLMQKDGWTTTIRMDDVKATNFYKLAVGEGFDIEAVKGGSEVALAKLEKVISGGPVRAAIDSLKDNMVDANQPLNEEVLVQAVKSIEGGSLAAKTYHSLVAMAEYELALENKVETLTHSLSREVDGITNGVCITTIQFAKDDEAAIFKMLNRMGIYKDGMTYNEWKATPGNQDSYQTIARDWELGIQANVQGNPRLSKLYVATSSVLGSFMKAVEGSDTDMEVSSDGRKIAKSPLMTSIYGAELPTLMDKISDEALTNVYSKLEKLYQAALDAGRDQEKLAGIRTELKSQTAQLSVLVGSNVAINSVNQLRDFKLNPSQIKQFKASFTNVYETPLNSAMQQEYGPIFDTMKKIVAVTNTAHGLFMRMYNSEVAKAIQENGGTQITVGQEKAIMQKLKASMPIVNSAASSRSAKRLDPKNRLKATLDTGIVLSKNELQPITDGSLEVQIAGDFVDTRGTFDKKTRQVKTTKANSKTNGLMRVMVKPGKAATPIMVQSIDGLVQTLLMDLGTMLNVHDAAYLGGATFQQAKEAYNNIFKEVNSGYSVASEVSDMFDRVLEAYSTYYDGTETLDVENFPALAELTESYSIADIKSAFRDVANKHDEDKVNYISKFGAVEQYSNGEDSQHLTKTVIEDRTFGSSSADTLADDYDYQEVRNITALNTEQVFDELQKVSDVKDSADHTTHLRDVLTDVINKIVTPFNLHTATSETTDTIGSTDGVDMYIVNQTQGTSMSPDLTHGIRMSASEVFVHELVHNVTKHGIENIPGAKAALAKIWKQAKSVVTPEMLMEDPTLPKTSAEYKAAVERWKHIFEPTEVMKDSKGRSVSNHLHEFVALGMTNQNFIKALGQIEYQTQPLVMDSEYLTGKLAQAIKYWFNRVMDFIADKLDSTYGKTMDKQLEQLFRAVANVDTSNKAQMMRFAKKTTGAMTEPLTKFVSPMAKKIKDELGGPLNEFKEDTKAKIANEVNNGRLKSATQLAKENYEILAKSDKALATLAMSMVTEARGSKLSTKAKSQISEALLKTGSVDLLDRFSEEDVVSFLTNTAKRDAAISELTEEMKQYKGFSKHYIKQSKNLASIMVHGKSHIPNGMTNAKNIADGVGLTGTTPVFAPEAAKTIDALVSLLAMQEAQTENMTELKTVIETEAGRSSNSNGLYNLMNVLKDFKEQSNVEFKGNDRHLAKGFMADKVNPNIDVRVGTEADRERLEAEGYTFNPEMKVGKDKFDEDKETKYLFVNRHGATPSHIGGLAYKMNDTSRGTSLVMNVGSMDTNAMGLNELELLKFRTTKAADNSKNSEEIDRNATYSIPTVNQKGEISDYRYVMQESTKDEVLDRVKDIDEVLGIMFSNLAVKERIRNQNSELVTQLKDMYFEEEDTSLYVEISNDSPDPELREHWRLLPEDMKAKVRKEWGMERMYVRKDSVDLIFGYHKDDLR